MTRTLEAHAALLSEEKLLKLRARIRAVRSVSRAANEMCINMLAESRFERLDCGLLCRLLLTEKIDGVAETLLLVRRLARKKRRQLSGEPAVLPKERRCFRVITLEKMARLLCDAGIQDDEESARAFLEELLGQPASTLASGLADAPLGRHIIWSTFLLPNERAWPPPDAKAEEVLCALGIEGDGSPILLLSYFLPLSCVARLPTFWDAYSADPWNPFFRVAARGEPYGLTMQTSDECCGAARPEVVHEVIVGQYLDEPLRYLSAASGEMEK